MTAAECGVTAHVARLRAPLASINTSAFHPRALEEPRRW
jgi:hypothetical protein